MPEFFINGDLYIKLKPDYETKIIKSPILDHAQYSILNLDIGDFKNIKLEELPEEVLRSFEQEGFIKRERISIQNNDGFYQIFYDGISFKMINKSTGKILEYKTFKDIQENFINFYEFVNKSIFCGRELNSSDASKASYEALVTYSTYFLLKNKLTGEYTVLDRYSEELKGYELGFMTSSYIERQDIYKQTMIRTLKKK